MSSSHCTIHAFCLDSNSSHNNNASQEDIKADSEAERRACPQRTAVPICCSFTQTSPGTPCRGAPALPSHTDVFLKPEIHPPSPKPLVFVGLDHWCYLNALPGLANLWELSESGTRFNLLHVSSAQSIHLLFGIYWLSVVANMPVATRPKVPQCKKVSTNKANMLLSGPINGTLERTPRTGNGRGWGTDSIWGTSMYGNRPQSDSWEQLSGCFNNLIALREWHKIPLRRRGGEKKAQHKRCLP